MTTSALATKTTGLWMECRGLCPDLEDIPDSLERQVVAVIILAFSQAVVTDSFRLDCQAMALPVVS